VQPDLNRVWKWPGGRLLCRADAGRPYSGVFFGEYCEVLVYGAKNSKYAPVAAQTTPSDGGAPSIQLPRDVLPVIGFWFWHPAEFERDGYKRFVDTVCRHSDFNVLTAMMMVPKKEVTDADVALWRDSRGMLRGVLQGWGGPTPAALTILTSNWLRLAVPTPLPPREQWLEKWW
jgi:hypothetical protein